MELDSGDEAESQFFKSQRSGGEDGKLFPPSVWDFGGRPGVKRRKEGRGEGEVHNKRRKRKSSSKGKENLEQKDVKDSSCLEEDEESLRAILLAQVSKAQIKKPAPEPVRPEVAEAGPTPPVDKPQKKSSPARAATATPPTSTTTATTKPTKQTSLASAPKPVKAPPKPKSRTLRRTSSKSNVVQTLSKADREKHFPNLSRKTVIPSISADSDSEEEGQPPTEGGSSAFGLNLEAFLKEARNKAAPNEPSKKPTAKGKRLMLTPQLKAKALKLTLADKKRLISYKISHLSRSKQIEYQRLKEMLAKKEAAKKEAALRKAAVDPRLAASVVPQSGAVSVDPQSGAVSVDPQSGAPVIPQSAAPVVPQSAAPAVPQSTASEDLLSKAPAKAVDLRPSQDASGNKLGVIYQRSSRCDGANVCDLSRQGGGGGGGPASAPAAGVAG